MLPGDSKMDEWPLGMSLPFGDGLSVKLTKQVSDENVTILQHDTLFYNYEYLLSTYCVPDIMLDVFISPSNNGACKTTILQASICK